jgi:lipopolysaccharide export system permease protein
MLRKRGVISHPQMPYAMWVREVQGRKLIDVTIKHRNAAGDTDGVIMAKEAELKVDMTRRKMLIRMKNGSGSLQDDSQIVFDEKPWELDLPPGFGPEAIRRPRDMTWVEMFERRRGLEQELVDLRVKISTTNASAPLVDAPPDLSKPVKQLEAEEIYTKQQIIWIDVELLMRPALSAGCFCFILVGCPVGIWFSRSDFLSSFITCFLPIVILYYPLMLCGTGMAKEGRIDPVLLVWAANLVMGAIGGLLFWRLLRN